MTLQKRQGACPRHLHDADGLQGIDKDLYPLRGIAHLDGHLGLGHVHDLRLHDLAVFHDIPAVGPVIVNLYQKKLSADALGFLEGADLDDVQLLVQLFFNLLQSPLVPAGHDGHVGDRAVLRLAHRQGIDIKAPSPEQSCHLAQNTGPVLHQYGINSFHLYHLVGINDALQQSRCVIRQEGLQGLRDLVIVSI